MKENDAKIKRKCHKLFENIFSFYIIITFALFIQLVTALNCPSNTWTCDNKFQCINSTLRCNSIVDCDDGSDEGVTCSKSHI